MAVSGHMIISGAVPIAIIIAVVARIISGVAVVVIPAGTDRNRSVGTPVSVGHASGKRSEEHTSELQSLMRISYAVFCLNKQKKNKPLHDTLQNKVIKKNITPNYNTRANTKR